jgi:hypothetical protein
MPVVICRKDSVALRGRGQSLVAEARSFLLWVGGKLAKKVPGLLVLLNEST